MILGLGIDAAELERLNKAHQRFGQRFLEKILSPAELAELAERTSQPASYLAGRFAAKEAAVKALGCGFAQGVGPRDIEITRGQGGAPQLRFLGQAQNLARNMGVRRAHLSISHERSVAVAVVVLEA